MCRAVNLCSGSRVEPNWLAAHIKDADFSPRSRLISSWIVAMGDLSLPFTCPRSSSKNSPHFNLIRQQSFLYPLTSSHDRKSCRTKRLWIGLRATWGSRRFVCPLWALQLPRFHGMIQSPVGKRYKFFDEMSTNPRQLDLFEPMYYPHQSQPLKSAKKACNRQLATGNRGGSLKQMLANYESQVPL